MTPRTSERSPTKISAQHELACVVVSRNITARVKTRAERAKLLANRISLRLLGAPLARAWRAQQAH